jgi:D-alanyl-D-alanine dipeptidase
MIDDAIMSIGDGAAGNATFGKHDKGHLIDKAAALKHEEDKDHDDNDHEHPDPKQVAEQVPQPKHAEGNDLDKPEKVEPAPAVKAEPPKKAKKAAKRDEEREKLFDELYNEQTGRVRADKLHKTIKKGKKTYELDDAQYEFKKLCYRIATQKMTGRLYGGCDEEELEKAPGSHEKVRKEVVSDLSSFISAAKAAGHTVRVTSGYRPPEEDMGIWDSAFNRMYIKETQAVREKRWPDDPYGQAAAEYLVDQIKGRKAPPGKSNHSNGIAVDFTATVNGHDIPNEYNNQKPWRTGAGKATFEWLRDNAPSFGFKNLSTEAWHYDWKK